MHPDKERPLWKLKIYNSESLRKTDFSVAKLSKLNGIDNFLTKCWTSKVCIPIVMASITNIHQIFAIENQKAVDVQSHKKA